MQRILYSLNLLTVLRPHMLPIHQHTRRPKHTSHMHQRIVNPNTLMRARTKHKEALRVLPCDAIGVEPSFWEELLRLGVNLGVVERGVEGGDDHASGGDGVGGGDGEGFGGFVGYL